MKNFKNFDSDAQTIDFNEALFGKNNGPDIYRNFMPRIRINEPEDKKFKIADPTDKVYKKQKEEIIKIIELHLKESKRILEVYQQFEPLICGTLNKKVDTFLNFVNQEDKILRIQDRDYAEIIKEIRFYQKLSRQLPTLLFLPMFEVGTKQVKIAIQTKLDHLLDKVFDNYESKIKSHAKEICETYEKIKERLSKPLLTAQDIVEMDLYKTDLLVQMTSLLGQISEHRESVFFMLRADRCLSSECEELVLQLVSWPQKLDDHMALIEKQNEVEKGKIEEMVDQERLKWKNEAKKFNKEAAEKYS